MNANKRRIFFAINARQGAGGQGEFLRQMAYALDSMPGTAVLSRGCAPSRAAAVDLPFSGMPEHLLFNSLIRIPVLRGRQDWLTLLSDLEFDRRAAESAGEPELFDGVMGQCALTFERLRSGKTARILTALNTHIDYLYEALEEECRLTGQGTAHFIHPRMRRRALQEIAAADRIRVNSEWIKQTFVERGVPAAKIKVIRPSADPSRFYPVRQPDDVFRVLAVASIDPRKGIHYLLQAFTEAKIPNSELLLIGGTGSRWSRGLLSSFRRKHANIRHEIFEVNETGAEKLYGPASVLVHPAVEEGYGLVIAQALACGRPVIATRQSGAAELIAEGKTGFVIERRSVEQIKDRLQTLANDAGLRRRMGASASASVSHLTDENFSTEVRNFYGEILGKA